ncbi:MAG: hypothetical protein Q8N44_17030 [Rubrivivax sp.]|nr:hypothetical protein [Rubrivivax sp.]
MTAATSMSRRSLAWLLVLALLLAKAFGLAHRSVHALGAQSLATAAAASAAGLFDGHQADCAECRIYDALAHADAAAGSAATTIAAATPPWRVPGAVPEGAHASAVPYSARAPSRHS